MNKHQVYKKWLDNGQVFYHIDKTKEPTTEERKIIIEILQQENRSKAASIHKHKNEIKAFDTLIKSPY